MSKINSCHKCSFLRLFAHQTNVKANNFLIKDLKPKNRETQLGELYLVLLTYKFKRGFTNIDP